MNSLFSLTKPPSHLSTIYDELNEILIKSLQILGPSPFIQKQCETARS